MNKSEKAAVVTGGGFGLLAVGFAAIVGHPVVLAAALYGTYKVGKAAYDKAKPGIKLTEEDYKKLFM
jgi:ABC-type uncharacterized transport system permease subunit